MDIITMASVALQMVVDLTQIALIGSGIESAIVPAVDFAVAIVRIVMTILEYVLQTTPLCPCIWLSMC